MTFCLLLFFYSITNVSAKQNDLPIVNVLTWWGYLGYPEIREKVKNVCHADISYDEYYSNEEFLRRFDNRKQRYDILIFSYTVYNLIKNEIGLNSSNLWKQSLNYNPIIKKHYINSNFPPNIVYFQHSLTEFLWNPAKINLLPKDNISTIFNKAGHNFVLMIDDPVEAKNLLERSLRENNSLNDRFFLIPKDFKSLIKDSRVYVTNGYNNLYKSKDFAFSYNWSGDAILILKQHADLNYKLLIHPKLSYITIDLLASLNNKSYVNCVAKVLSSKEISTFIQNKDYYFSPYTDISSIPHGYFRDVYIKFLRFLPSLPWIKPASKEEFTQMSRAWDLIKINVNG
jgi:hypothetical protein